MRILGLDLSTTATGWAVVDCVNPVQVWGQSSARIEAMGTIKTKKGCLGSKFQVICEAVGELVEQHKPEHVRIEELTHFRGADSVRALVGIQGAIRYHLWALHGLDVDMVRVSEARKTLGINQGRKKCERGPGFENLIKDRVLAKVRGLGIMAEDYDQADAVVILLGA
jgi:Holliday junction resolvasome RuvABC endonuclease subunit